MSLMLTRSLSYPRLRMNQQIRRYKWWPSKSWCHVHNNCHLQCEMQSYAEPAISFGIIKEYTSVGIKPITSVLRVSFRGWLYETTQWSEHLNKINDWNRRQVIYRSVCRSLSILCFFNIYIQSEFNNKNFK